MLSAVESDSAGAEGEPYAELGDDAAGWVTEVLIYVLEAGALVVEGGPYPSEVGWLTDVVTVSEILVASMSVFVFGPDWETEALDLPDVGTASLAEVPLEGEELATMLERDPEGVG